ncbi:MAG: VanZ family protein [Burkholderiaceae bacterium]
MRRVHGALSGPLQAPARKSVFARVALLVYVLIIVYASWYPFSGWHVSGLSPLAFITAPLPHYWTGFDVVTNIIGYLPLGVLSVFALYPAIRGWAAILLTITGGILLSGLMEAVQTYLPSRVSSNLDLIANSVGICIGALFALAITHFFLEDSRFLQLREDWFTPKASRGLLVVSLWPLAQIYPQAYLFGHGQFLPLLSDWLSSLLSMQVDIGALLRGGSDLTVEQYWLSEAIITACGLSGALLTLSCVLSRRAPRGLLLLVLTFSGVAAKSLASALLFGPDNAFGWITPGAWGGMLFGLLMLTGLLFAPRLGQRRVAILMLMLCLVAVNATPANPYFIATMQGWTQGKFLNFNGASRFLSLLWPYLALWFLLHRTHRQANA